MKRLGKKILELKNINKRFGDKILLKDFSYQFQRGEKIGIVGKNGVGKSTLLNIVQGLEPKDSGEIEVGETIKFGYFSQKGLFENDQSLSEIRVIDFIKEISENFPLANGKILSASQFLKLFLFDEQIQYSPIAKLSGGEKRRLNLIKMLYENPNFLIFDEPTNDLDLPTLSVLENFLLNFQGCLIIVSHDRYFMDRIIDRVLAFENEGRIRNFTGNFSEYRSQIQEAKNSQEQNKKAENKPTNRHETKQKKLSYKEQRELEQIEKDLPILEEKRDEILQLLNNETDYSKISILSTELKTLSEKIEIIELRWLELQEKS